MAGAQGGGAEPNLGAALGAVMAALSGDGNDADSRDGGNFPNRPPFLTVYRSTRPCPTEPHGPPVQLQAVMPDRANKPSRAPPFSHAISQ